MGAIAEYDKSMLVQKLRLAREAKRVKNGGKCEGRKAFGMDPNRPGEHKALQAIYNLEDRYWGPRSIADHLNDFCPELQTRSGKPWRADVIRRILKRRKDE